MRDLRIKISELPRIVGPTGSHQGLHCSGAAIWYPVDPDQFDAALRAWGYYHPDDPKNYFLSFPWPQSGEVPKVSAEFFKPRDEEKAKIRAFIDRYDGEDDPWLMEFVVLAKELVKEVH